MEQNVLKQKGKKRKSTKKPIRKSTQVRGLNPAKPSPNLPDIGDSVHITGKGANKNERGTVIGYVKFARGWKVKLECMHNGQHYYCYASPHEFDVVRKVGGRTTLAAGRRNPKTKWPPEAAITYARNEGITFSDMEDYHMLSNSKVYVLTELAKSVGYRKPTNASGSRTRYFYYYLKRKSKK